MGRTEKKGGFATELPDITKVAIARGSRKDISIINTDHEAHSPINAIRAEESEGGVKDNLNPVIVAYNGSHYESLEPVGTTDSKRAKELIESYIKGQYKLKQSDIKIMTNIQQPKTQINTTIHNKLTAKVTIRGEYYIY